MEHSGKEIEVSGKRKIPIDFMATQSGYNAFLMEK